MNPETDNTAKPHRRLVSLSPSLQAMAEIERVMASLENPDDIAIVRAWLPTRFPPPAQDDFPP